jgi:hypothetical protein
MHFLTADRNLGEVRERALNYDCLALNQLAEVGGEEDVGVTVCIMTGEL